MAKSELDAGRAMLKAILDYKCDHAGIVFKGVNESHTTQTCSRCGALPDSRPKGIAGLEIREWACGECSVASAAMRMRPGAFLQSDMGVWLQESPSFRR
ncbi:MAG: zinc ribbon domain-containing protein [Pontibacterium sp.]